MNFLSHFYFVQSNSNPYLTLGSILPDLFRIHRHDWKFTPEKQDLEINDDLDIAALFEGWKLHLEVDALFHNCAPFKLQSSLLRKDLQKVFIQLPKRPFFIAHIGYELILDSLLLRNSLVDSNLFYQNLSDSNDEVLTAFMRKLGITETQRFHAFLENFVDIRYLESYNQTKNLVNALDGIGRRVWVERFTKLEYQGTFNIIEKAIVDLNPIFLEVYDLLEKKIKRSNTSGF